jgi:hypothetical protein
VGGSLRHLDEGSHTLDGSQTWLTAIAQIIDKSWIANCVASETRRRDIGLSKIQLDIT